MKTITIPAKYENRKLIPLEPLPDTGDYDALIILLTKEDQRTSGDIDDIQPLSLGRNIGRINRETIYDDFR